jgi:uncharacterized membrane protein YccC
MTKSDDLGDRMKGYELAEAGRKLMPRLPVIARLSGTEDYHKWRSDAFKAGVRMGCGLSLVLFGALVCLALGLVSILR